MKGGDGELGLLGDQGGPVRTAVICFAAGTPVETAAGEVAVERLAVGDLVRTLDHGLRPVRWIGSVRVDLGAGPHPARPVRIGAGALGPGVPVREIVGLAGAPGSRCRGLVRDSRRARPRRLSPRGIWWGFPASRRPTGCGRWSTGTSPSTGTRSSSRQGLRSESLHPRRQALSTVDAGRAAGAHGAVSRAAHACGRPAARPGTRRPARARSERSGRVMRGAGRMRYGLAEPVRPRR